MNKRLFADLALLFTAFIWGISFVAQRAGMNYVGPYTFNAVRSLLGAFSLIPVIILRNMLFPKSKKERSCNVCKAGLYCGVVLFLAVTLQQYCMQFVDAANAGFICSLYVIYVPVISMFLGEKIKPNVKVSVCLSVIGLYLLCFKSHFSGFNNYDFLILISAFFYGVHILIVNHFSKDIDAVETSCLQFAVVGTLSLPLMFVLEHPNFNSIVACHTPILFAGVLTCGLAYTLQIIGQKYTKPVVASLIMCTESVFAAIGGILILNETMTLRSFIGAAFMVSAVLLAQFGKQEKTVAVVQHTTLIKSSPVNFVTSSKKSDKQLIKV